MKFLDITGKTFQKLTAIRRVENSPGYGQARWLFRCECGKEIVAFGYNIVHGRQQSCGCYTAQHPARLDHGMTGTKVHTTWAAIHQRCNNPNTKVFKHYGGRGIKVCERWSSFRTFLLDMGEPPGPTFSIERIDNDGDYCKENCKWVERKYQIRNRRVTPRAMFNGSLVSLSDIADATGIPYKTLHYRHKCGDSGEELIRPSRLKSSEWGKN